MVHIFFSDAMGNIVTMADIRLNQLHLTNDHYVLKSTFVNPVITAVSKRNFQNPPAHQPEVHFATDLWTVLANHIISNKMRVFTILEDENHILNPNDHVDNVVLLRDPFPATQQKPTIKYWHRSQDHSKFGYTFDPDHDPYFCVGDNNRDDRQLDEGGSIICIIDYAAVQFFRHLAVYILVQTNPGHYRWDFEPPFDTEADPYDLPFPRIPPITDRLVPFVVQELLNDNPRKKPFAVGHLRNDGVHANVNIIINPLIPATNILTLN